MTQIDITTTTRPSGLLATLHAVWQGLGEGLAAYMDRNARIEEMNRLSALSDAELAQLGLTRDRIPHHVFRDLFHI